MKTQTRFGRMKSGGSQTKLLTTVGAAGLVSALAAGSLLGLLTEHTGISTGLAILIYATCQLPVWLILWWLLLVDRDTIAGAVARPEDSVETRWYSQAAESTFHTCLWGVGVLGVVSALWDFSIPGFALTLGGGGYLIVVFGISYQFHKRRES